MFAVAGVSGHTGAATAEALLKQGQKVRVLVRDAAQGEPWLRRHAEVAVVDLHDADQMAAAVKGLSGAYLLLPPVPADQDVLLVQGTMLSQFVKALKRSTLKHLTFLSSAGAQHPAGTGPVLALHRAEKALAGIVPSVTFLRPSYFLENWGAQLLQSLETGTLTHFGHVHPKFNQVCARDIGEAAAKVMIDSVPGTRVVEVTGREPWSVEDLAIAFASLLGQPIKAVELPVESAKDALEKAGMIPSTAALYAELYHGLTRGLFQFAHAHQIVRGTTTLIDALKPLV